MQATTISNNGRITLPATLRRKCGWSDGSTRLGAFRVPAKDWRELANE